ncbi:MAG TPA: Rne/Rng family ribonuclease, partial [Blastocatellia bacterium]
MTKELIISANVHEKKVAIIEDGIVSEFYVERSDENQGVVGNLYKGRVMKVLPGMQSAFVDIALERDAFLYVSDFAELMEDEDLIEFKDSGEPRVESKPGGRPKPRYEEHREPRGTYGGPGRTAQRELAAARPSSEAATEEPSEAEAAQQSARMQDVVEQLAEMVVESVIPPPPREEDLEEGFAREPSITPQEEIEAARVEPAELEPASVEPLPEQREVESVTEEPEVEAAADKPEKSRSRRRGGRAEPAKPQRKGGKKPDKSEGAKEPVEAGASRESSTKRGSRRRPVSTNEEVDTAGGASGEPRDLARMGDEWEAGAASEEGLSRFERVTDDDLAQMAGELLKDAIVQEKIIERVHKAEYQAGPEIPSVPPPDIRVGTLRSQLSGDSRFQRVRDEEEAAFSTSVGGASPGTYEEASFGAVKAHGEAAAENSSASSSGHESLSPKSGAARSEESGGEQENEPVAAEHATESEPETGESSAEASSNDLRLEGAGDDDEDREASIRGNSSVAEFAIRRGGRGRRRRREPPAQQSEESRPRTEPAPAEEESSEAEFEGEEPDQPNGPIRAVAAQPEPAPQRRPDFGPPPQRQQQRRQDLRNPTISELLREGQEILVQIAKEPIAKKGARITSHIALPGRYLVYMPTVNHIGVSRKIGSEAERIRLKRTVTALRDREGGTGGFIVRTACENHSEQELQDDMRYLLRTWGDVKKKAEKTKSPALIHRDLDLVQRILRDHLSDEFSAIRIDNEVEFARLVEFVNRIQPRLVKRVKLYTGDQPILEKYGVQQEIDKAVKPRVWLKSGGYIVINQTEALVAIDVNTGKFVGKSDRLEDTITRTNLEAAKEIVRQIRLRDLGGIIVLDLIDMEERKNRQRVMA